MSDHDLLKLAGKAAGYTLDADCYRLDQRDIGGAPTPWNPLTDDGDALRLAAKLRIRFERHTRHPFVAAFHDDLAGRFEEREEGDYCAAIRRAIVRVAVELERKKQCSIQQTQNSTS